MTSNSGRTSEVERGGKQGAWAQSNLALLQLLDGGVELKELLTELASEAHLLSKGGEQVLTCLLGDRPNEARAQDAKTCKR